MKALLELRKQMEIEFLKTKTYEEINDMFNQLNDKLKLSKRDILRDYFRWHKEKGYVSHKDSDIDEYIASNTK